MTRKERNALEPSSASLVKDSWLTGHEPPEQFLLNRL